MSVIASELTRGDDISLSVDLGVGEKELERTLTLGVQGNISDSEVPQ